MAGAGSREELLDRGVEMLLELPAARVFRFLTARAVSKRAGRTTGSFYHVFESQQDYYQALVQHIFVSGDFDCSAPTDDELAAMVGHEGGLRATIAGAASHHRRVVANPFIRLIAFLASRRGADSAMDDAAEANCLDYDREYGALIELHLAKRGRKVAPPLTSADVAAMFNAMADGLSLRSSDHAVTYAVSMVAILEGLSVPLDSDGTLDDVIDRVDARYPTVADSPGLKSELVR